MKSQPRTHSVTPHASGINSSRRNAGETGQRACSAPTAAGNSASTAQNRKVASAASHAAMPPCTDRLTNTQLTPAMKKPSPQVRPTIKPARIEAVRASSVNSTARLNIGKGQKSKGAKPATASAPAPRLIGSIETGR